jgi:alcohol dehydrogenase (cytochrome c)
MTAADAQCRGRKIRYSTPGDPAKEPQRDGRLVAPNEGGATNYRSPSFDPPTGLLVVSAVDAYGIYFFKKEHVAYG